MPFFAFWSVAVPTLSPLAFLRSKLYLVVAEKSELTLHSTNKIRVQIRMFFMMGNYSSGIAPIGRALLLAEGGSIEWPACKVKGRRAGVLAPHGRPTYAEIRAIPTVTPS